MKWACVVLLVALVACRPTGRRPRLPERTAPPAVVVEKPAPKVYEPPPDPWVDVFDRADDTTLAHLKETTRKLIEELRAQDETLSYRPPAVVRDARTRLRERIALEEDRLARIEVALSR